ncbi:MAG: mechanosensitive ion channel family protein, partial [Anaerolineae bacterium]
MEEFQVALDWGSRPFISVLIGVGVGILILLVGRWLARLIARYATRSMERAQVDEMVIRFSRTLIYFGLMAAVVIAALNVAGIHTTSLTALL